MNDLPATAVANLYPFLVLLALVVTTFSIIVGGLWAGFRWLKGQIRETAEAMISPVAERLAVVEKQAAAAHRRIDLIEGKVLHEHG